MKKSQFVERKRQFVVSNQVVPNARCGSAVIFCGFISLLIGRETINIPEIFSGVHGFTGKTVIYTPQFDTTLRNKGYTVRLGTRR